MNKDTQKIGERILTYSTVTSLVITCLLLFEAILEGNSRFEESLISPFVIIFTAVSGFIYMIVLQLFVNVKNSVAVHVRFIFFYLIIEVVICFLSGALNAPYVILPVSIVHYLLEAQVNSIFLYHDYFMSDWQSRSGKELIEYLFHNNYSAVCFAEKQKKLQTILVGMSFFLLIFLTGVLVSGAYINFIILPFILIFAVSVFFCFLLMGLYDKESYFAFLGFDEILNDRRSLYKKSLLIFFAALFIGFGLSSNKALINIPKISEKKLEMSYEPPEQEPVEIESASDYDFINLFDDMEIEHKEPGRIYLLILKILKYTLITVLAALLLYFLIHPFFTKGWKQFWAENTLLKFLKKVFREFRDFIKALFKVSDQKSAYRTVEARSFKESINDFLKKSKKSKEKKLEIDRLTRQFMQLIDWGSKRNIKYTKNLAPAEYTQLLKQFLTKSLAEYAQEITQSCNSAGKLYEKALYDSHLLSDEEQMDFSTSIKKIMALPAVKKA